MVDKSKYTLYHAPSIRLPDNHQVFFNLQIPSIYQTKRKAQDIDTLYTMLLTCHGTYNK